MTKVVSFFEASIDDCVLEPAETLSCNGNVVNTLSKTIGNSSANQMEAILSLLGVEGKLLVMDLVVSGVPFLELFSVEAHWEAVAGLLDSVSGGMVELQDPVVGELRVCGIIVSGISLTVVGLLEADAWD